jgi:hypothetical protein
MASRPYPEFWGFADDTINTITNRTWFRVARTRSGQNGTTKFPNNPKRKKMPIAREIRNGEGRGVSPGWFVIFVCFVVHLFPEMPLIRGPLRAFAL